MSRPKFQTHDLATHSERDRVNRSGVTLRRMTTMWAPERSAWLRNPRSFDSKPGLTPHIEAFTCKRPELRLRFARPVKPPSEVRDGSNDTCGASGRWKYRCDNFCARAIASGSPLIRLKASRPFTTQSRAAPRN